MCSNRWAKPVWLGFSFAEADVVPDVGGHRGFHVRVAGEDHLQPVGQGELRRRQGDLRHRGRRAAPSALCMPSPPRSKSAHRPAGGSSGACVLLQAAVVPAGDQRGEPAHHCAVTEPFGQRLWSAVERLGPLCVGIDPHAGAAGGLGVAGYRGGRGAVRPHRGGRGPAAGAAAVVKPQSARSSSGFGSAGVAALERVRAGRRRAAQLLCITDVKRGDIGTTAAAYAEAYLDPASPLASDAITVSPYLGVRFAASRSWTPPPPTAVECSCSR